MNSQKRGPKAQTLIMVPLSELVSKLPSTGNVKLSRVWYEEIQKTLGFIETVNESVQQAANSDSEPENKILVQSINLDSED